MGKRIIDPRLQELYDSNTPVYSISRLDTINGCLAEAYRTYVLNEKGRQNIYGVLGGRVHEVLEDIVNERATEADLLPAMQNELEDLDALEIEFPKDFKGGDSIREGWIKNMTHFCEHYTSPKGSNFVTEQFFLYKTTKGHWLQGYIDLQRNHEDGSIDIYDYKTSSMYSGEDLKNHARQLVLYQMAKEQEGYKVNNVAWIFLKYVEAELYTAKTQKSKERSKIVKVIERKKIGAELAKYVERDLIEAGYDEIECDIYLSQMLKTNDISELPPEVGQYYKIRPYVCKYEVTDEVKQECENYINNTIEAWEEMDSNDESIYTPRQFTKLSKTGKVVNDYFYCTNLCSHFKKCGYIKDFLDNISSNEEDDILF